MAAGCHAVRLALLRMPGRRETHELVQTTADATGQMPGFRAKINDRDLITSPLAGRR
jgi:hypothetical protein